MPINSFDFWLVFPFIFALYWVIPSRFQQARKTFLLIVSYLLYLNWKPAFALVLLGVTTITYIGGRVFERESGKSRKKLAIVFSILGILPLCVFKYYNFLNNNLTELLKSIHIQFSLPGLNWAIPVGISFFTFQAVGYMLDVYHKRIDAEHNFLDYMLFVSFFPQVTSGPISKASELLPQIKATHKFDFEKAKQGVKFLLWGMFLKMALADRLGLYVDSVISNFDQRAGVNCLIASIFYSIQIYGDFAGYSLIAIGIAKTLGFNLINNFERPYFSISVTDFWRRWHISLSRWLKDYIYIPLGGSRCSKARNYWNIFVTFLVSGIWHGANWTYIVWGCFHGIAQIIEKALGLQKCNSKNFFVRTLRIAFTFTIVSFAWIFFRMPSIGEAMSFISHIFTNFGSMEVIKDGGGMVLLITIVFLKDAKHEFRPKFAQFTDKPLFQMVEYVMLVIIIFGFGVLDSSQFIYFNF